MNKPEDSIETLRKKRMPLVKKDKNHQVTRLFRNKRSLIGQRQQEKKRKRQKEIQLIKRHSELCLLYRTLQKAKTMVRNEQDLDEIAHFYHAETLWIAEIEQIEQALSP